MNRWKRSKPTRFMESLVEEVIEELIKLYDK